MDNKNWITQLAEKKPSPALVASMYLAIVTLSGWVWFLYSEIGKARDKEEEKAEVSAITHRSDLKEKDLVISSLQTKLDGCTNLIVQRTDDFFKQQRQEYLDRIGEQKLIESKRSRLQVERSRLLKSNANQLNTLENIKENEN